MTFLSSTLFSEFLKRVSRLKGVFLGFNLNIDVVIPLKENPKLLKILAENFPQEPLNVSEVNTLEELSFATFLSFSKGSAAEYLISDEVHEKISSSVENLEERVGGPVGIVGNVLASLGIRCLIHGPSFSPRQVKVLRKDLLVLFGSSLSKIFPREEDPDLIHWIFEFKRGERLKFGKKEVVAPRENRVIFSHDHLNSKMFIREEYKKLSRYIGEEFPNAIISGHHLLTPRENYKERLKDLSTILQNLSRAGAKIHSEMAYNPFPKVRREIISKVIRNSNSLGLNEVELSLLCEDLGICQKGEIVGAEELAKCCLELAEELGIDRIHLHTYGLYLECVREGGIFRPDKLALEISSVFAAAKAKKGDITSIEDLKEGEKVPIYPKTEKEARKIDGIKKGGYVLVAVPSRIVENPKATVGIGDMISSSAFLFRGDRSEIYLDPLPRISARRSSIP